jgi:F plasmid transfer operon protein TraF
MLKSFVFLVSFVIVSAPSVARAQIYESVGTRAQGMGGAFVAIADDATATWWNPAGVAGGAYANAVIEYGQMQQPRAERDAAGQPVAAWRTRPRGFALAFPALGLSYYRVSVSEIQPLSPTAAADLNRQDQGTANVRLRALVLNQFGATVGQSVGNHLVIASTLKLVRGSIVSALAGSADASLDAAQALSGPSQTHADLDLGALARFGHVRAGFTVKNVRAPEFGTGADQMALKRQARAGVALVGQSPGLINELALAFDADLTRTTTAVGDERHVAGGIEAFTLKRHLGLRGGLSANTVGSARVSPSVGASLGVRTALYVEGQLTGGNDAARRGWGLDLRLTF